MTGYDDKSKQVGRRRATVAELRCDYCSLTYGTSPCTASVGVTGPAKCFNTRATCQDPVNYNPQPKSYYFSDQPLLLPPQGQMIIVAGQGSEFAVSFDGGTYTLPPTPPPGPAAVIIGMSVGTSLGHEILLSPDMVTFTAAGVVSSTPFIAATKLSFANGFYFLSSSDTSQRVFISSDKIAWTQITPGIGNALFAYGAGVLVGTDGVAGAYTVVSSDNGATWTTPVLQNLGDYITGVLYDSGFLAQISYGGGVGAVGIMSSVDGITWSAPTATSVFPWGLLGLGLLRNGGVLLSVSRLVSTADAVTYTSTDAGGSWTPQTNPWLSMGAAAPTNSCGADGVGFMVISGDASMFSADGVTWIANGHLGGSTIGPVGIFHLNGAWYMYGGSSAKKSVNNGATWTDITIPLSGCNATAAVVA